MATLYATHAQWDARVAARPPGYADVLSAAVVRRDARGVHVDTGHPGYAAAVALAAVPAVRAAPVVTAPPTPPPAPLSDPLRRTLAALARVQWPHRGSLVWSLLRTAADPSDALLDAVALLLPGKAGNGRDQLARFRAAHPPDYGPGWRRWLWELQGATGGGHSRPTWAEAERRAALAERFGPVRVISLARTPGRLDDFYQRLPRDWPLPFPILFDAVDGQDHPPPADWWPGAGDRLRRGAHGCRLSHMGVLDAAAGSAKPAVILEDDFEASADFADRVGSYLKSLPERWEIAYLGAEHMAPPTRMGGGIVRVRGADRTHAMVVSPAYLLTLRGLYAAAPHHIDWRLREIASARRYYAPHPPLAAQGENASTIEAKRFGRRLFPREPVDRPPEDVPVVVLEAPAAVVDELRQAGRVHTGNWRGADGIDVGLARRLAAWERGGRVGRLYELDEWAGLLRAEAAAMPGAAVGVWSPGLDAAGAAVALAGLPHTVATLAAAADWGHP